MPKLTNTWEMVTAAAAAANLTPIDQPTTGWVSQPNQTGVWKFRCRCGVEFSPSLASVLRGSKPGGATNCGCVRKIKTAQINTSRYSYGDLRAACSAANIEILSDTPSDAVTVTGVMKPLEVKCRCGKTFHPLVCHLLSGHTVACGCRRIVHGPEDTAIICERYGLRLVKMGASVMSMDTELICRCGRDFSTAICRVTSGNTTSCGCTRSRRQLEIADFLTGLGHRVETNNRTILNGLELDIWLPDLKLGIEYDGLYWHSEAFLGPVAKTHRAAKVAAAAAVGIRLVVIFEDEWLTRRPATESRLRAIAGRFEVSLGARVTEVENVEPGEAGTFLDAWHLQGRAGGQHIGLRHDGVLVAVATFAKANVSRNRHVGYELMRYCCRPGYRIGGGFSKLIKTWQRQQPGQSLLSYADARWSVGDVYRAAGFRLDGTTPPSYWYFRDGIKRLHRFTLRKDRLLKLYGGDAAKTEWELAKENGYNRVWDLGCTRWVLPAAV